MLVSVMGGGETLYIWVWDRAKIIELILKHALDQYPVIKDAKTKLDSLTKFFRDSSVRNFASVGARILAVGLESSSTK